MKIHWHKPLYMGARAREKRFRIIQRLRLGCPMHGTHVITPAVGERNLLDIYPAWEMKKPCYRDREFFILGIGADYDDAVELAGTGEHIYRYLREQPDKIPAARRFLTYYLDTVGRILIQYVKFQEAGLRTEEVLGFQDKVRAVLPKLRAGFEEQLSQLMAAERFDAEADMQVLERLLDTEGFSCGEKRS